MWGGPRFGPRGPPFRGNLQGPRFSGQWRGNRHDNSEGPMHEFRGRDEMHHHPRMGFRPDRPPVDFHRRDLPPNEMRGREIEPVDPRGREPMDFRGREPIDVHGRYDTPIEMRKREGHPPDFRGRGRHHHDVGRQGEPVGMRRFDNPPDLRERPPNDFRGREVVPVDRRRLPLDILGREGHSSNMREREMGFVDSRERLPRDDQVMNEFGLEFEGNDGGNSDYRRRNLPPGDFREEYGPDMDFRNRNRPPVEMRERDAGWNGPSNVRGGKANNRNFGERDPTSFGYRNREDNDWQSPGYREREFPDSSHENAEFRPKEGILGDYPEGSEFQSMGEEDGTPFDFAASEDAVTDSDGWNRQCVEPGAFGGREIPGSSFKDKTAHRIGQEQPGLQNLKNQEVSDERLHQGEGGCFRDGALEKDSAQSEFRTAKSPTFQDSVKTPGGLKTSKPSEIHLETAEKRDDDYMDQDYRDIDYRLASNQGYEYGQQTVNEPTDKTSRFSASDEANLQDQDYRSDSVKEKPNNILCIKGIPKSASEDQVLTALSYPSGVRPYGMKISKIVPGYSYDTAFVEFLNLEDAVRFMESKQKTLKIGEKILSMCYAHQDIKPEDISEDTPLLQRPFPKPALLQTPPLKPALLQTPGTKPSTGSWTLPKLDPVFQDSHTMIIKNLWSSTTVETIVKALDPFAYLEPGNIRLIKPKQSECTKCFCFVDMDSHEEVSHLVETLRNLSHPFTIDHSRVRVEIAKPLKKQSLRKDYEKSPGLSEMGYHDPSKEAHHSVVPAGSNQVPIITEIVTVSKPPETYAKQNVDGSSDQGSSSTQKGAEGSTSSATGQTQSKDGSGSYSYDVPDVSTYLYDSTSGFYYDPQTTLYYDANLRYYYNADTQQYLYWDSAQRNYIPVPDYKTENQPPTFYSAPPTTSSAKKQDKKNESSGSEGQTDKKEDDPTGRSEKKEGEKEKKEKDEKPRSLTAHKIAKDMERWAKIQNRQKECIRAASPVLQPRTLSEEKKISKSADAAFAIFEKKGLAGDDLFKKPFAPPKKDETASKRQIGSLGVLIAEYGGDSDEEEDKQEEQREEKKPEKEDKLTDWKKMACLLCRRQFPNKDALIRHQKLSELHKQNLEIHYKIRRSELELQALERQEQERTLKGKGGSPESKRRKYQSSLDGEGERGGRMQRSGDGKEPLKRKKGQDQGGRGSLRTAESYRDAVRKAMFARYKELE
ncbi:RNA-binding protein 5 isoform X2 [Erpetoichthys calabaricus]|uniref:RNA-binding protein 5 isoform X2 n=1 Tax=Erpetoichthys calabaricus TaxID=27687 RepID=UPI00109F1874|nr:RNA-binding protein 5 isoform X2 [Erpetoichthys calabaricus]